MSAHVLVQSQYDRLGVTFAVRVILSALDRFDPDIGRLKVEGRQRDRLDTMAHYNQRGSRTKLTMHWAVEGVSDICNVTFGECTLVRVDCEGKVVFTLVAICIWRCRRTQERETHDVALRSTSVQLCSVKCVTH
jgi:hypothetical protein